MKKFIRTLIIIIVIVAVADRALGYAFQYFYRTATTTDEYKINTAVCRTETPVLFMGSSRCHHHYVPSIIADTLHQEVYNAGLWGMRNIYFQYGLLSNILERYKPRAICLEIHPIDYLQTPFSDIERVGNLTPFINYSSGCDEILKEAGLYYKCQLSSLYRYNSEFANILVGNLSDRSLKENGFKPLTGQLDTLRQQIEPEKFAFSPDNRKIHYLQAFIDRCRQENIDLLFLYSPMYAVEKHTNLFDLPDSIAHANNVPFLNCYNSEGITGHPEYYADYGHLNESGARKYSFYIASKLKQYIAVK